MGQTMWDITIKMH